MKQGWEIAEFEKCLEKVTYTNKIQRKDFKEDGIYPIVSQEKDFINGYWDNEEDLYKVDKPVIIFGDHTQVIKFIDFDFVLGADGVKILKPKDKIDSKYFYYFLQNIDLGSLGYARHYRLLKEINVAYPKSLPEQQRIVSILDEAFAAIAKAKANAKQNLKNAKELFESYLQGVFEKKGDGWEERKLGESDLLEIIDGDRGKNYPTQKDFLKDGFCLFMNTKNVRPDGFEFETTMFISEAKDKAMGKGKLKRNDVVMTTRGTIGNLGVYDDSVEFENIRINSGMLIFRPNTKVITPHYLFETFRSGVFKAQIKKHTTGAAQPQLPIKTLVTFTIPVPIELKVQQTIVRQLDALRAETQKLEAVYQKKIDDLEELKKSILRKAFAGELRGGEPAEPKTEKSRRDDKIIENKINHPRTNPEGVK